MAVGLSLSLGSLAVGQVPTTQAVLFGGHALPSGHTLDSPSWVHLDDVGRLTFFGYRVGAGNNRGIFRYDGDSLTPLLISSTTLQDGSGRIDYPPMLETARVSEAGEVAVITWVRNSQGYSESAVVVAGPTRSATVARRGDPSPDGNGVIDRLDVLNPLPRIDLNASGSVVFNADLDNYTGDHHVRPANFLADDTGLSIFARGGQPVPGQGHDFYRVTHDPVINAGGQIAFAADIAPGFNDNTLLIGTPAGFTALAVEGRVAPESTYGRFNSFYGIRVNAGGQVAFVADLIGGSNYAYSNGLYLADETGVRKVVYQGESTPAGDATFYRFGSQDLRFNDAGEMGFFGELAGPGISSTHNGVFRANGDELIEVIREGDAVPGGDGRIASFDLGEDSWNTYRSLAMNQPGSLAFVANVTGTASGTDELALFYFDDNLGLLTVAREGQALFDSTLTSLEFTDDDTDDVDGLNNHNTVAYRFSLSDSRSGIATWTPPSLDELMPGDANLDGTVSLADFLILRSNFGSDTAYFTTGDFTRDGVVSLADFLVLRANFGGSGEDAATIDGWLATVPEPTGVGLLTLGCAAGLLRRRRPA